MAKRVYFGVGGKARKVKKIYFGVDGKARRVKKGYIGIGGVARQFFSGEPTPVYHGTATSLSQAVEQSGYSKNDNYGLFIGGYNNNTPSGYSWDVVNAYNKSLVRSIPAAAPYSCTDYSVGAQAGTYAVVFGGAGSTAGKKAFAYSASLAQTSNLGTSNFHCMGGAASIGNYAIGGGGRSSSTTTASVEAINGSLSVSALSSLTRGTRVCEVGFNDNYVLFGIGNGYTYAEAYNSSLVKTSATELSFDNSQYYTGAGNAGDYALIFQVLNSSAYKTAVYNAYNKSLVRTIGTYQKPSGDVYTKFNVASVNRCCFIAGGYSQNETKPNAVNTVYSINPNLVTSIMSTGLAVAAFSMGATSVGNYALFGGGRQNQSTSDERYQSAVTVYKAD